MKGRMCVVLGLVLLGALCFPALTNAARYDANTKALPSIQEAAHSAESVCSCGLACDCAGCNCAELSSSTSEDISSQFVYSLEEGRIAAISLPSQEVKDILTFASTDQEAYLVALPGQPFRRAAGALRTFDGHRLRAVGRFARGAAGKALRVGKAAAQVPRLAARRARARRCSGGSCRSA